MVSTTKTAMREWLQLHATTTTSTAIFSISFILLCYLDLKAVPDFPSRYPKTKTITQHYAWHSKPMHDQLLKNSRAFISTCRERNDVAICCVKPSLCLKSSGFNHSIPTSCKICLYIIMYAALRFVDQGPAHWRCTLRIAAIRLMRV